MSATDKGAGRSVTGGGAGEDGGKRGHGGNGGGDAENPKAPETPETPKTEPTGVPSPAPWAHAPPSMPGWPCSERLTGAAGVSGAGRVVPASGCCSRSPAAVGLFRGGAKLCRTKVGAAAPGAGWVVAVMLMTTSRPEGDFLLAPGFPPTSTCSADCSRL